MQAKTVVPDFTLLRDTFGRLILTRPGSVPTPVRPVRSFPISQSDEGLALLGPQGRELAWIQRLDELPESPRRLITEDLAQREFHPRIEHIHSASSWTTPSRWEVDTDRGAARLILNAEDDIRRLSTTSLLIADASGVHFMIPDTRALDRNSRRILDHFL